jgi:hypothetical protein
VVDNVSLDIEAPVVTSLILRFAGLTWFFEDAHRSRVCVRVFLRVSVFLRVRVLVEDAHRS